MYASLTAANVYHNWCASPFESSENLHKKSLTPAWRLLTQAYTTRILNVSLVLKAKGINETRWVYRATELRQVCVCVGCGSFVQLQDNFKATLTCSRGDIKNTSSWSHHNTYIAVENRFDRLKNRNPASQAKAVQQPRFQIQPIRAYLSGFGLMFW